MERNSLFGTYSSDGYYFYLIDVGSDHLFGIRYEEYEYDDYSRKSILRDQCSGFVDFVKGELLLEWNPCDNSHSYRYVQIVPYEKLKFEFVKQTDKWITFGEDGKETVTYSEPIVYLKFLGGPDPQKKK